MTGFVIKTKNNNIIRFHYYLDNAPLTSAAFSAILPFSKIFYHARVSGQEIWIDNAPEIDVMQENCSVFSEPGEIVIGPRNPVRNKIANCIEIFYGDGKLLDCGNIFGKVYAEDFLFLKILGDAIWRSVAQELSFDKLD